MITVGGVNVVQEIVNLELRVAMLEKILDRVLSNPGTNITQQEVDVMRGEIIRSLQQRFPNLGIKENPSTGQIESN